jgi:hypothetical protein
MKLVGALLLLPLLLTGQSHGDPGVLDPLPSGGELPEKILSSRSVVLYSPNLSSKEVGEIHESLVRTGIDAVAYFENDRVFAGEDVAMAFTKYFLTRETSCFVVVEKQNGLYRISATSFSGTPELIDTAKPVWSAEHASLKEALRILYSTALNAYKRQNFLINDSPETDLSISVIEGRRIEAFASDLKVDRLAIQKFGNEKLDQELEAIMKEYPLKFALVDRSIAEPDLRRQGYAYVLKFVHSRAPVAKQLLGYETSRAETAVASIAFSRGVEQVKMIPSDTPVFKFYFRQIEFNNVYLGTRWDADTTWQQALINFISGMKKEMRLN